MNIIKTPFKWNGTLTKRTKTEAIVLHHAEAQTATAEQIHSWHQAAPNKWAGIGYNFYIRKDGKIYEGRGWDKVGAHAGSSSGYNLKSIGICFEGAYNDKDKTMPQAQFDAGVWLIKEAMKRYGNLAILKHSAVTATNCPGQHFPFDAMVKTTARNPYDQYQKIIQDKCKFGYPPDIWKLCEAHPHPEEFYKKWANSYGK